MSLRLKLREATAPAHTAIESNPTLAGLLSADLSEAAYVSILKKYYGFFSPLEKNLAENELAHTLVPDLEARFKTSELHADLLAFGLTDLDIAKLPVCRALPSLSSGPEILGTMYVTEGSALGGLMISKHLSTFPYYREDRGSFFHADPKGVSTRWKSYLAALEGVAEADEPAVVGAALKAFAALDGWMRERV